EINPGVGSDFVAIRRTSKPTVIGNFGDLDVVDIGNSVNGVQGILTPLNIFGEGATNLNISDTGNAFGRAASHTINAGLASISGLAPALINYRTADLQALSIFLGSGADTFNFGDTTAN